MADEDATPQSKKEVLVENTQVTKERKKDFSKSSVFNVICGIVTILSFFFGFYFYYASKIYPQLIVFVHPIKPNIIKSGQASDIKAFYRNEEINTDVTVAQVAIWNQGNASIKKEQILKPIILFTDSNTPILEAEIRKSIRGDITKLALNQDEIQNGRLTITWNILEQYDGGVIQIIYAGDSQINVNVEGVIEGQQEIKKSIPSPTIESPQKQYVVRTAGSKILIFAILALMAFISFVASLRAFWDIKESWESYKGINKFYMIIQRSMLANLIFGSFIYCVYILLFDPVILPPFDIN